MALGTQRTRTILAVAATLALAACSDSVSSPSAPSSALRPSGPHLILGTTSVMSFWVNPTIDNIYQSVEGHRVVIPANAICQVGTSGYGKGTWDNACTTATAPILFTITTTTNAQGLSNLTVQPDVRFSPAKQVMAFFKDSAASRTAGSVIQYCHAFNGVMGCVDEGKDDASMATYRDPSLGYIYRRLKHFSGYNVIFGVGGDGNGSGGGMNIAKPMSISAFSGYITTVGLDGRD
jgi:hypothetical protein